jgi:hypothetical protein
MIRHSAALLHENGDLVLDCEATWRDTGHWVEGSMFLSSKPPFEQLEEPVDCGFEFCVDADTCPPGLPWQPPPVYHISTSEEGVMKFLNEFSKLSDAASNLGSDDGTEETIDMERENERQGSWLTGGKALRGNPIWCFPEGRIAQPTVVEVDGFNINKGVMQSVKAYDSTRQRCIPCPDCLECSFDGYKGIPFVAEGWTTVNPVIEDSENRTSAYAGCGGAESCGYREADATWDCAQEGGVEGCPYVDAVESVAPNIYGPEREKPGYAGMGGFYPLDVGQSALVHPEFSILERNVLGCPIRKNEEAPYGGSCRAELDYRYPAFVRNQTIPRPLRLEDPECAGEGVLLEDPLEDGEVNTLSGQRSLPGTCKNNVTDRVDRCNAGYSGKLW